MPTLPRPAQVAAWCAAAGLGRRDADARPRQLPIGASGSPKDPGGWRYGIPPEIAADTRIREGVVAHADGPENFGLGKLERNEK